MDAGSRWGRRRARAQSPSSSSQPSPPSHAASCAAGRARRRAARPTRRQTSASSSTGATTVSASAAPSRKSSPSLLPTRCVPGGTHARQRPHKQGLRDGTRCTWWISQILTRHICSSQGLGGRGGVCCAECAQPGAAGGAPGLAAQAGRRRVGSHQTAALDQHVPAGKAQPARCGGRR